MRTHGWMDIKHNLLLLGWLIALLTSACQPQASAPPQETATRTAAPNSPAASATPLPTQPPTATSLPQVMPTATPANSLWIAPYLPAPFQNLSQSTGLALTAEREKAQFLIEVGEQNPIGYWIFALAAPFPTLLDSLSGEALRQAWQGELAGTFASKPILLSQDTLDLLTAWWGAPASEAIKVLPAEKIESFAWENQPSFALLPFEDLSPRWKVIEVEGQSPLWNNFDLHAYPLSIPVSLIRTAGTPEGYEGPGGIWVTNRDPNRLTTLILTGVTALVRGTALTMESKGVTYPGEAIAPWLRQADFTHVNIEVPFYDQCPYPEMYPAELRFCSAPKYIRLLEDIGVDIVELSGDHFSDYGAEALEQTLAMYRQRGWRYYGGGANAQEARQPILLEHHGNRLAILGCNSKGLPYYAQAGETTPGAVACDFDLLTGEIARLRQEGYLVIVTFQDVEYYSYTAQPRLVANFRRAAQAGAVIVSGSQAHQPHGMEFFEGAFIHYGLGNLFFDQYRYYPGGELDRAFIDRHVFYDGRYIGTELLTIQFIDLARPRPTTAEERQKFLKIIFTASGW